MYKMSIAKGKRKSYGDEVVYNEFKFEREDILD
jgi:hypothetical protein